MSKFKFSFALLLIGCSGAVDGTGSSTLNQKLGAADARAKGDQRDLCATHGWYGDGVCDTFCTRADTDCVQDGKPKVCAQFIEGKDGACRRPVDDACRFQDPDCDAPAPVPAPGEGTACALFLEKSDGVCSRSSTDPCRSQDPDCTSNGGSGGSGSGGATSTGGNGGVVCAQYIEVSDGVCKRAATDACRFQDPDCTSSGSGGTGSGSVDCDTTKVTCQTFAPVICPDGQVPSVVNNCYGACVDPKSCEPGSIPPPDGSGGSTGGGAGVDCDPSKIKCQTFAPVTCPDGQVPSVVNECYGPCVDKSTCAPYNTGVASFDCNPYNASGQTPPACPKGQVPRIVNGKYDTCVEKSQCEPVACLAFIETADGTCSRAYNDPCRGQDPDCSAY